MVRAKSLKSAMENKKIILRFNKTNPDSVFSFKTLKNGSKNVETRAATDRYKNIAVGDKLIFVCGKNKFNKKVKKATVFKSIDCMLRIYKVKDIMPDYNSKKELEGAYFSYPGYREKIKKFGIIAFEI